MENPDLSVVVPVYNEEENILELHRRLTGVMKDMRYTYELIFVNDGSFDTTLDRLKALQAQDPHISLLDLARNFGHQAAVTAGIDHAAGRAVIVIDGDLQDPPEVIPDLVARWQEGYEVVYAIRTRRKEGALKRLAYGAFYRLMQFMADTEIPLDAGDFSLIDRRAAKVLRQLPERNRFVRGLRSWVGFRQIGVPFERAERHEGQSKYTLRALVGLATSGFISFSKLPLRIATYLGTLVSGMAFLSALAFVVLRLVTEVEPRGWTSVIVVVLFLGGVQLVTLGILGEYLGYVLDEVRRRPPYVVREWRRGQDRSGEVQ
jgi:dolichol-phosphate mannosyltransferase